MRILKLRISILNKYSTLLAVLSALIVIQGRWLYEANAVTYEDYKVAVADNNKVTIGGLSRRDGKDPDARLYKPAGNGPFPALIALHGAGGIFPYQLWWARKISSIGFVVLFVDSYCTRGYLCVHNTDDNDPRRKQIMQSWDKVDPRQRVMDTVAGYRFLESITYFNRTQ